MNRWKMIRNRYIRIIGLIAVLSYMIVVLYTWISSTLDGITYFSAGETNPFIKYPEWLLGIFGMVVVCDYLKTELNH